jgi:4-amino-4-deoxy-L-arabinose transferase-like glycosyltransferase
MFPWRIDYKIFRPSQRLTSEKMKKHLGICSYPKALEKDYTVYALVFLLAICARAFFFIWIDEPILFSKYTYFAEKLAEGKDIGERIVDLSPFYLYFLTFLRQIFGIEWDSAKLIQSFVGAFNALLILALGSRVFNKTAGILAAILYALYGNIIILESTLEPTAFICFFNLLLFYFLLLAKDFSHKPRHTATLIAVGGLFAGLSIITKPNSLLFVPLGIGWLLFCQTGTKTFRKKLALALIYCISALAVVAPVTLRNYIKLKDFVFVTADAGKVFYHGNSRTATALDRATLPGIEMIVEDTIEPDYAHVLFRKTAGKLTGHPVSPSESSHFWVGQTLRDIYDDPPRHIKRTLKKLVFFFTNYELHYIASAHVEYKRSLDFPLIPYGIIISLAVLGMVLSFKRFREFFLLYGAIGVYIISGMLFLMQSRYRTPAVPYLCLFAGGAIYSLKEMICTRRFKSFVACLLFTSTVFVLSRTALKGEINRVDRWQEATKTCYQMRALPLFKRGSYKAAIPPLDRCLSIVPDFRPGLNLRGRAYAMMRQYKMAETDFLKLISLNPDSPQGYRNIGFAYLLQGQNKQARAYLLKALSLAPDDGTIKKALKDLK